MTDDVTSLDRLTSSELRERAIALAKRRWDVLFFWRLLESLPAAEAAAGHIDSSNATVAQASGLFYEALSAEEDKEVQEVLRPIYIDYLIAHADEEADAEQGDGPR